MTAAAFAKSRMSSCACLFSFVVFIALIELLIRVGLINRFIVPSRPTSSPPSARDRRGACAASLPAHGREAFSACIMVTIVGVVRRVLLYRYHLLPHATETWVARSRRAGADVSALSRDFGRSALTIG